MKEQLANIKQRIKDWREANVTGEQLSSEQRAELDLLMEQERVIKLGMAKEWERTADLSDLGEMVEVPREVLNELGRWFESGLTRDEHLLIAACPDGNHPSRLSHLAAIKLFLD